MTTAGRVKAIVAQRPVGSRYLAGVHRGEIICRRRQGVLGTPKITLTPTIRDTIDDYLKNNPDVPSLEDMFPGVCDPEAVAELNAKTKHATGEERV